MSTQSLIPHATLQNFPRNAAAPSAHSVGKQLGHGIERLATALASLEKLESQIVATELDKALLSAKNASSSHPTQLEYRMALEVAYMVLDSLRHQRSLLLARIEEMQGPEV